MNFRLKMPVPMLLGTVAAMIGVGVLTQPNNGANTALLDKLKAEPKVSFATVETIITARCLSCHAKVPSSTMFNAPPGGVMFDSPQLIAAHAERIFVRSVQTKTMPLGNMTGLTEEERTYLGAWIAQGADIKAEGASAVVAKAAEAKVFGSPAEEAKSVFGTMCVACHGSQGMGDGPSAVALTPKPRAFSDPVWQASVDDAHLTRVILEGGMAVGKSPIMPANEDLVEKPEVVKELVKIVRGFKKE
jgi:cytochrome c